MSPRFFNKRRSYPRRIRPFRGQHWNASYMVRRMALYVMIGFFSLLTLTSVFSYVQAQFNLTSETLKKWTNHMSVHTFIAALTVEIPQLQTYNKSAQVELPKVSNIVVEMATSLNPEDPRTLIRREIPGFAFFDGELIVAGQGVTYADISYESSPPLDVVLAEREAITAALEEEERDEAPSQQPSLSTEGRKVVFIYHTHNRESWMPHVPSASTPDEAFHPEINITKVGLRLGEELERRGIGVQVDTTDIGQLLSEAGLPYNYSYAKSRHIVETAIQENEDITFMFDLHRDAVSRESTTFEMDGKTYARPFFVIGKRNPNYQKNVRFAEELNRLLEERYPGLSRGIMARNRGNAEYNQSISEHNLLIEIGGVENTLEESYRTAEILAEVIADLYWEKAGVPAQ
ncbi:stage II sporulation protein P [Caldalkalibacillus thermarum TA2.A1]|uniref:Stage II sporulation protein P n=2 Tax=Caldalkalibacillus thermarum (strain TA2.A1) TaxID=986075 RepID=F5L8R6_CALTT|nr:stage II sporulation protein P [Caldalkalibacillus thermarum]EGL82305.1 stage II sporulation protein P [Caldalkalibacillus thermarum TA2.A1]